MFCSIIVPTYNTDPERLDALVASVDAQTLDAAEFEILFVDDGSTTDVVPRLHEIAANRANVRVIELENSGWACRPRNQGTLAARGDWVLYMDHDDVIFPEALERLKHFTTDIEADVVNPKEVRTKSWYWGWDSFYADRPTTSGEGPLAFLPMTPHKLYRRSFLIDHDIAFIEDRRVLWEDVFFNVLAYSRGARVAVFSSYPIYHWVQTGKNTSATFGRDRDEMWGTIRRLLEYFAEVLTDQADIDGLTLHWYRTRVLRFIGSLEERTHAVDSDFEQARAIAMDYVPERLDAQLDPNFALIAKLLRADDHDGVRRYAESTAGFDTRTTATDFAWNGDAIEFDVETQFTQHDEPLTFNVVDDRVLLPVPSGLTPNDGIDITAQFTQAEVHLSARGVATRESAKLDSFTPVQIDHSHASASPTAKMRGRVSLPELVANRALVAQRWDIAARVVIPGLTTHKALRIPDDSYRSLFAVIDGRQVAALRGKETQFTVAIDTDAASALSELAKDEAPSVATTNGAKTTFEVQLPVAVHLDRAGSIACEIAVTPVDERDTTQVGPRLILPARLETVNGRSVVRSEPSLVPRGTFRVTVGIGDVRRRIGLSRVEKNAAQRVAGFVAARSRH